MPANLTPEYEKAEQRYRQAATDEDRLVALQEMLSAIPKHKGTEKMQADLKRRLSHLRREQQKTNHNKGPDPFHLPKTGAGQVVLVGPPNTGKSSLLAAITHAEAKVADYPFTTVVPQPGMWVKDGIPIELIDTPPLTPEHVPSGLMGTIRSADIVCVVVEAGDQAFDQVESGLAILSARQVTLHSRTRNQLLLLDPHPQIGMIVANKIETVAPETLMALRDLYAPNLRVLAVSAHSRQGFDNWFNSAS